MQVPLFVEPGQRVKVDTRTGDDCPKSSSAAGVAVGIRRGHGRQRRRYPDRIDEALAWYLRGWDLDGMAVVDRTLARMAAWELMERPDVPTGAALSELVELATQYCGAESPRFLNGLLSAIAKETRDHPPPDQ